MEASKQFDYLKHQSMLFPSKNKGINRLNLGMTIRFASSSSINDSDGMQDVIRLFIDVVKSLPLDLQ